MLQNPHHHHHGVMPPKRRWSKPHPQQSFAATSAATKSHHSFGNNSSSNHRQPLKQTNHRPLDAVVEEKLPPAVISVEQPSVEEWKPCGVLKKPGSYRGHASLKKVAFLENTELNRSTL